MFILAQIFGGFALISFVISTQMNNHKKVLLWRTIYDGFLVVQYFLLGAYTGVVTAALSAVRNFVYGKYKKDVPIFHVLIFCILNLIFGFAFYDGPISLLAVAHTIVCTIYLGRQDLTELRMIQAFASAMMFVYNLDVKAYVGLVIVVIQFISLIVGIARFDRDKIESARIDRRKGKARKSARKHKKP